MTAFQGFSLLLWVRESSPLLAPETLPDDDSDLVGIERGILDDCCVLLGMRWNVEFTISNHGGKLYAFGSTTRFTVSNPTVCRGLGDLSAHVEFIRGSPAHTLSELVRYKECRDKWNVPEILSESSTGLDPMERPGTSHTTKRRHY